MFLCFQDFDSDQGKQTLHVNDNFRVEEHGSI